MTLNIIIIAITAIISIMAFYNPEMFDKLKFDAYLINKHKQYGRFFTYALIHASWLHLFINMFVLYSFGDVVEKMFRAHFGFRGELYFALLYIGGILFSTLFDFGKHKNNPYYSAVGASGAVSAVVFASILLYPSGSIYLFPIPFPIPSWAFGIVYLIYSAYMGKRGKSNIGHSAHFWGAIFGIVYTILLIPGVVHHFITTLF